MTVQLFVGCQCENYKFLLFEQAIKIQKFPQYLEKAPAQGTMRAYVTDSVRFNGKFNFRTPGSGF